jgi:putative tricarboxylic transport membrane protein
MVDRIILGCTLLLAGIYFWATEQIPTLELGDPLGPKAFPRMLGIGLLIAAAMLLAEILRDLRKTKAGVKTASSTPLTWESHDWVVVCVAAWTCVYVFAFEPAGYMIATAVYLLVLMAYFNRGRWVMNVSTAVLFSAGSYFAFTKLLGVSLARGIIPF